MPRSIEERAANTRYARERRAQQIAQANALATRCAALLARRSPCNTKLQSRFVNGATVPFCPTCDRKARGICIDCGAAPVNGTPRRALRCASCGKLSKHEQSKVYRKRHAKRMQQKERDRMADPVKHAAKVEYGRLYRKSRRERMKQWKKADYAKHRERYLEYHRKYRAARRAERAEFERLRWRGELPPRQCLTCPTIMTGRAKKCDTCKQNERRVARAAIVARVEANAA